MNKGKKYYVCDRKKCPNCITECRHTADETHAKYDTHFQFEADRDHNLWEVIRR